MLKIRVVLLNIIYGVYFDISVGEKLAKEEVALKFLANSAHQSFMHHNLKIPSLKLLVIGYLNLTILLSFV